MTETISSPPLSQPDEPEIISPKPASQSRPFFRGLNLVLLLIPLTFALGLGAGYLLWGRDVPAAPQQQAQAQGSSEQQQAVKRYDVPLDDDPVIGPENAAITLIEFSDYECPYCRSWHAEVFDRLMETYPDQVRVVYRDFPLTSIHPNAVPAAEAANCAYEQGGFWEFHRKLFDGVYGLSTEAYTQYASEIGLDQAGFEECLNSRRYKAEVEADFEYAANLGVRSTPTFFLNGLPIVGAQPFEVFQEVIEKELAGEIPK